MKVMQNEAAGWWWYAVIKFRRAVTMNVTEKDSNRCNVVAECERLKAVKCGEWMKLYPPPLFDEAV